MRAFAQKQNQSKERQPSSLARSNTATTEQNHHTHPILQLQRAIGNQAVLRLLENKNEELKVGLTSTAYQRFGNNFAQALGYAKEPDEIQTSLTVSDSGDIYEQEADRVAAQVMRMPDSRIQLQKDGEGSGSAESASQDMSTTITTGGCGHPLPGSARSYFESRFGHDFSTVRVHSDSRSAESARVIDANAYTVGRQIHFGREQYRPQTEQGIRLLAHELTHVVQQSRTGISTPPLIQRQPANKPKVQEAKTPDKVTVDPKDAIKKAAESLVETGGTAKDTDKAVVVEEMVKIPLPGLSALKTKGVKVVVCHDSVTEIRTDLKGKRPRGWPEGKTWDTVPGLNDPNNNRVIIATRKGRVPPTGDGHGAHNLVLHEVGHAVGDAVTGGGVTDAKFVAARNKDKSLLDSYEGQTGDAGVRETYAESFARFYGKDPADAKAYPNLHVYWASNPLVAGTK